MSGDERGGAMSEVANRPGDVLRVANCSGFYGDRLSAAREMVEGGPIDVLTGDYLAELTMMILWKLRQRDPEAGYARTFLTQMEEVLATCAERGIKVVSNAGGLNPRGLAARIEELARRLGVSVGVAVVEGDDLMDRIEELLAEGEQLANLSTGVPLREAGVKPVTANAYLGAFGIATALAEGADVVVCGRVTDASVVVGPAAWRFGWRRDDWDRLASAVVAGHILECGAQATGGNYAFFTELPDWRDPGFPIAEIREDGSFVVTKHEGTGGLVSVDTVTAQLLYELGGPRYLNPDVVARFDTIELRQAGPDRVEVRGVRGEPAPSQAKVCLNYAGGYRNSVSFVLTGLDIEAKADFAATALFGRLGGRERFREVDVRLLRRDKPDAPSDAEASAELRVTVKDDDPTKVGRAFSQAAVELALACYPGFHTGGLPGEATAYAVYWPALVSQQRVPHVVVLPDGRQIEVPPPAPVAGEGAERADSEPGAVPGAGGAADEAVSPLPEVPSGPTRRAPLGAVVGARSGDKGGDANVGVWTRTDEAFAWLRSFLDVERFKALVPEAAGLVVHRYELPNLRALNFVVEGLLGEGVASSTRFDPQAKGLGEFLRSRLVEVPVVLLDGAGRGGER
jgi:hypothetical protein